MNETGGPRIVRADTTLRVVTLAAVGLQLALGVVALVRTEVYLNAMNDLARTSPERAAAQIGRVLKILAVAASVIPLTAGAYLARLGILTSRYGEFPPPGTRVLVDTYVIEGAESRRWAHFALVLAALLVVGGVVVPVMTWTLVNSLLRGNAGALGI